MELFHFLSVGPHVISEALAILSKNKGLIEELIREMKFIPFPPRQRPKRSDTHHYRLTYRKSILLKMATKIYENNRQLNVIVRAILICKYLVVLQKEIGYCQICSDVNDLDMQEALLILFPPTSSCGYVHLINRVNERLEELIELGFDLMYNVIGMSAAFFWNQLLKSKKFELWNDEDFNEEAKKFSSKIEYQEEAFRKAMTEYMEQTNEYWILKTFGANADTTKAYLNSELPPNGWTKCSYEATVNIWKIFCNIGVPFKYNHMQYLSHATHEEVLDPLFKGFLPKLFKIESTTTYYLNIEDSNNQGANGQNAEGQHETSVNITLPIDCNYTTSKSDYKIFE
ncbi:17562_t:CDS:2 [Acaulospora morrowiae]|uniref:17562_t:CDS:1 n=1 Tax=Acaulospora morrowiae TaxID=94023 RepID=A0A9N9A0P4_9GLOM|nr:17562_t:CDS:2 [Acaulospora morrowiae]